MYKYAYGVAARRSLSEYMPALASAISVAIGDEPEMFFADLVGVLTARGVFPLDLGALGRQQRVTRLLEDPVQVGEFVLRLERPELRKMYKKTKKVTKRYERLEVLPGVPRVEPVIYDREPHVPRAAAQIGNLSASWAEQNRHRAFPETRQPEPITSSVERRLEALEAAWLEHGAPPAPAASLDLAAMVARLDRLETWLSAPNFVGREERSRLEQNFVKRMFDLEMRFNAVLPPVPRLPDEDEP